MLRSVEEFFIAVKPFSCGKNVYSFVDGVEIGLRSSRPGDAVYIMKIRSSDRGSGLASETLTQVCQIADSNEVTLFLEVEEDDGLTSKELADWYWRFGFRGDLTEMIREPNQ